MKADIIIGANLGDEGKGLITDFYAAQKEKKCLVVRHNSGAQAGHTVTLQDGRRHVFSHIGAGSFCGASTYLSRFYVCNPLLFFKEYHLLNPLCQIPSIYVDRRALVTTPYDIMINQLVEEFRGSNRHGSCGVGFGEVIERNLFQQFAMTVGDLNDLSAFLSKLVAIRHEWLPKRLVALGIDKIPEIWMERIESKEILADYIDKTGFMLRTMKQIQGMPMTFDHIVCEGAQGLLLDQDHEWFPHVTRSSTGIRNAMTVLSEAGINEARVTYITRSYLTRHGAGPLPYELNEKPYKGIVDATNLTNDHQGHLRFSWLDVDAVSSAIKKDYALVPPGMKASYGLAVTCVDQIEGQAGFLQDGVVCRKDRDAFLSLLYQKTGVGFGLASYGPTRHTIRPFA